MAAVYPKPLPFAAPDLSVTVIPPQVIVMPTASFTVTPSSVTSNSANITLQDTSTGAPSVIEWDFTNDGVYDASDVAGATRIRTYTPGSYTIALRATNSAGSNVTTRTLTVNAPPPPLTMSSPYFFVDATRQQTLISVSAGTILTNGIRVDSTVSAGQIMFQVFKNVVSIQNLPPASFSGTAALVSGTGASGSANVYGANIRQEDTYLTDNGSRYLYSFSGPAGSAGREFTFDVVARTMWPANSYRWQAAPLGAIIAQLTVGQGASFRPFQDFATVLTYPNSYMGGNGVSSVTVVGGALPPGITPSFNGSTFAIASGTPTTAGTYNFTLRLAISPLYSAIGTFDVAGSITVNP